MNQNKNYNPPKENLNFDNYQIISELGKHQEGIYINYLAQNKLTNQPVILSRFILPESIFNETKNTNYQQILELLQSLDHQGIPRHLDCFESKNGFCLVQEYKANQPLTKISQCTLEEIKKIAISALEILTYLQEQTPPIFHDQICPNTLFIDSNFQVYLTTFGFATIGETNCPVYPLMNKNQEFIPPEQKRGKSLTKNSDLYSLGVTLFCLLTGKESHKINTLIGQDGSFNVQGLVSNEISLTWIEWLEKLIYVNPKHRYEDAITALNVLKNIDINRLPEVKFNPDILDIKSDDYGEIITKTVTITNPITDTNLSGKWEVASSIYDVTKKDFHPWISFEPYQFESNKINCQININTSKLKAGKIYQRQLILQANSSQENPILPLKIETAKIKIKNRLYLSLIILLIVALGCGWLSGIMVNFTPNLINWLVLILGLAIGGIGGYGASFSKIDWFVKAVTAMTSLSVGIGLVSLGSDIDLILGFFFGLIIASTTAMMIKFYLEKNCSRKVAVTLAILAASLGMSLGINLTLNNSNSLILLLILVTGLPLILMLLNPYWEYQQQMNHYRQQERKLIKS